MACDFARRIVSGELSPRAGAGAVWWRLAREPEAGPAIVAFVGFADEWDDFPDCRAEIEADIVRAAVAILDASVDAGG